MLALPLTLPSQKGPRDTGWAIMGPRNSNIRGASDKVNVNFLRGGNDMLDQQISQFLGLEISSSKKGDVSPRSRNRRQAEQFCLPSRWP